MTFILSCYFSLYYSSHQSTWEFLHGTTGRGTSINNIVNMANLYSDWMAFVTSNEGQQLTGWDIAKMVLEGVIGLVSILGNSLVIYVILKFPKLHNNTNYLMISLALADLLVGAVGIPCVIVNSFGLPRHFYGCLTTSCIIVVLTQTSIFAMVAIAVERLVAVTQPVFHFQYCRINKVIMATTIVWIMGALIGFIPLFGWNKGPTRDNVCIFMLIIDFSYMVYFNFFLCVFIPLMVIFIIYGYIFNFLRHRYPAVQVTSPGGGGTVITQKSAEVKNSRRVFLVAAAFAFCWLPLHIVNCIQLWTGFHSHQLTDIGIILSHANSALNPFLYAYGSRKIRDSLKLILQCRRTKHSVAAEGVNTSI